MTWRASTTSDRAQLFVRHGVVHWLPVPHGVDWWDETWTLPIVRDATIATLPRIAFTNKAIRGDDVLLVSGLSFSGSSGSPVFTHRRESLTNHFSPSTMERPLPQLDVTYPKLIGIMSGHFRTKSVSGPEIPAMLRHGGLSYLTRSTAILELIRVARLTFRNPHPSDTLLG